MKDSQCTTCQALSAELSRWESVRQQVPDINALIEALDTAAQDYAWERELGPAAIEAKRLEAAKADIASAFAAVLRSFPTPEPTPRND